MGTNLINDGDELLVGEVLSLRGVKVIEKIAIRHELGDDEDMTIGCVATETEEANDIWVGKNVHHPCLLKEGVVFCVVETLLHCHLPAA